MSRSFKILVPILLLLTLLAISFTRNNNAEAQSTRRVPITLPSKAGIHEGTLMGNEQVVIDTMKGEIINPATGLPYVPNLGLGYIVQIAEDKDKPGPVIDYIVHANTEGLIPIVRLCYPDAARCKFKSA